MHTSLAYNATQPGLPLGPKLKARPVILQEAWPVLLLLYLDESWKPIDRVVVHQLLASQKPRVVNFR